MKKIKMREPYENFTVSIKGDKDGALYRRAAAGDLPAMIIYTCANIPSRWQLDFEILPILIRMEPASWKITNGGFVYTVAA